MLQSLSDAVNRRPRMIVALVVVLTIVMMGFSYAKPQDPEFDDSGFMPDHEVIVAQEDISDRFSSASNVPVLLHAQTPAVARNVATSDAMVELLELEWMLANDTIINGNLTVPFAPAYSFVSLPHLLAPLVDPNATDFAQLIALYRGLDYQELQQLLNQSTAIPGLGEFITSLLSTDLQQHPDRAAATLMLVTLNGTGGSGESDERLEKVELRINTLVTQRQGTHLRGVVLSQLVLNEEINEATRDTTDLLLQAAFALVIIILYLAFRSSVDLLLTIVSLLFAIIWMKGLTALLEFQSSPFSMVVPILMLGLGVDYGIHLVMRYREELIEEGNIERSSKVSIHSVGAALALATFTTMVGFLSNASSPISVIKEFGVTVALGVFSAFIIFVTFLPACRVMLDRYRQSRGLPLLSAYNKTRISQNRGARGRIGAGFEQVMDAGATVALRQPKTLLGGTLVVTLVALMLASQLSTEFSFNDFLPDGIDITDEFLFMQDNFDFSDESATVYIRGDVAQPEVFDAIDRTQRNMLNDDRVLIQEGSQNSPLTVMQDLANGSDATHGGLYNATFAGYFTANDTDGDGVPETNITGLLDWLWDHYPNEITGVLYRDGSGVYTIALIEVKTDSKLGKYVSELHTDLRDDIAPLEKLEEQGRLEKVVVTGEPPIIDVVLSSINNSMIYSILITITVSAAVLTLVFHVVHRRPSLGLLTTLPVILVMVWILGTMFLMGYALNMFTILIGALTIGLGVTYAIHITHRFMEELEAHGDLARSTHNTVKRTGSALFGAAMTTVVGFGILVFSVQPPMRQFGVMTALTIFYAFLASVWVLPSMLVLWARYQRSRGLGPTPEPEAAEQGGPESETPAPGEGAAEEDEEAAASKPESLASERAESPASDEVGNGDESGGGEGGDADAPPPDETE